MRYMVNNTEQTAALDKVMQELRRGALALAALSQLREERYGYALIDRLASKGLEIDQGTLYPLLRRLEAQGLLGSSWNTSEARPRRYYVLTPEGERLLSELTEEWHALVAVMNSLLADASEGEADGTPGAD